MNDSAPDEFIHGLWNRQRARLPRFDAAHRERVLTAVAAALVAEPPRPARRPAELLLAAMATLAAAIVIALPSWLAVVAVQSLDRAAAGAAAVSVVARAEAVGLALPAESSGQLATAVRPGEPVAHRRDHGRDVLRSIDIHTLIDPPHFTLGETF